MDVIGHLRAGVNGELPAGGVVFGEGGVRLGLDLAYLGAAVFGLVDQIGLREARLDVADFELDVPFEVAGPMIVEIDGIGRHRLFRGEAGGQGLVFDPDEIAGAPRDRDRVGGDGRHSTPPLRDAVLRGLMESGCEALDVGLAPTPLLYYALHALDADAGIMITGSHNPAEYNGLKMTIGRAALAGQAVAGLRARIERRDFAAGAGSRAAVAIKARYMNEVLANASLARPLKVVVDCGNGVAGVVAPRLYERMGCAVISLHADVDGDFPNHHPDPAVPENLADLIACVRREGADVGLAFDGDGDRLGVVTNAGEVIWPDTLMMLFAEDVLSRHPGAAIVYDVKCSPRLGALIAERGGAPILCRTGHSHIKAKLRETGALLAGEFSGHLCFGDRWYGFDDALYSGARLLEILARSPASAAVAFARFPPAFGTPELKVPTTETAKFDIVRRLVARGDFGAGKVTAIDGVRVDYADGFGLVRASNTSPALTLRFEADSPAALARIRSRFGTALAAAAPGLELPA